ncbi:MAG: transglutaminase domain-containing protein [Chrysiogenales bacterium]|nr:MAG: transglutaminase domain-containing protein [Chrysiogenales bacterium]
MNKRGEMIDRGRRKKVAWRTLLLIAALFACLAHTLPTAAKTTPEGYELKMIRGFTEGDYPAVYASFRMMLATYPDHPLSRIYYSRLLEMADLFGTTAVEELVLKMKKTIKARGGRNANACLIALDCVHEALLYRYDAEKAKRITDELKPVREWALIGPFRRYGSGDMEYRFMSELVSDGEGNEREKRISIEEYDGRLRPGRFVGPGEGVVYARASFVTEDEVMVRVYCRGDYHAMINGRYVGGNVPGRRRNLRIFSVRDTRRVTLLLKLHLGDGEEGVRVLITDKRDAVQSPSIDNESSFTEECAVSEEDEFPHAHFIEMARRDPAFAYARLGIRLDGLQSEEAVEYYRKSLNAKQDILISYLLAASLLAGKDKDIEPAGHSEGWRLIEEIYDERPGFAPAALKRLDRLIEGRENRRALLEGELLVLSSPRFPYARLALLQLLDKTGSDREFLAATIKLRKDFPDSHLVTEAEAEYYRDRNSTRYLESCIALAGRAYTPRRGRIAAAELVSRGEYGAARELIQRLNFNNDLVREMVVAAIRTGDFPTARNIIFGAILRREDPWFYEALGRMDMVRGDDPSMYLYKLLSMDPSRFEVADYLRYLDTGDITGPPGIFLDQDAVAGRLRTAPADGRHSSTILYRGRTFLLQNDGSSRAFCEDIIHLSDAKGVWRYGEIRIPCRGRFNPVRVRVYNKQGIVANSYTFRKEGDEVCVNIASLGRNSIIHLAYSIDNAVFTPGGGRLFSYPPEYLQGYNEPAVAILIKVITPEEMEVDFRFRDEIPVESIASDGFRYHTIRMGGLSSVEKERLSGDRGNSLAFYSFSTMNGFEDFSALRKGSIGVGENGTAEKATSLKKEGLEKTVAAVYDFVSRGIDLDERESGLTSSPENILNERHGTAEEKAMLARALLDRLGIRSYLAFGRDRLQPVMTGYMFHEYYTDCLLFVPLDRENSLWLDFSSRNFACGTVSGRIDGTEASIMINGSHHMRSVRSSVATLVGGEYRLRIKEDGGVQCAIKISFNGSSADARSSFRDTQRDSHRAEETAHLYVEKALPGFSMDGYRVRNLDDCEKPLVLEVEGAGIGALIEAERLIFRPVLRGSAINGYVSYPRRSSPLVIETGVHESDRYRWTLPESFRGAELNKRRAVRGRFGNASIIIRKKKGSVSLYAKKTVHIDAAVIGPDEYPDFLDFCRELQRLEGETIILE